jgi:hypothetical protein
MQRNVLSFFLLFIMATTIFLTGCRSVSFFDNSFRPRQYQVTGQVSDIAGNPVTDCNVYLVMKGSEKVPPKGTSKVPSEILQQVHTDQVGQYLLTFETGQWKDVWLTFTDSDHAFIPLSVRLNPKMGDTPLDYPGNSAICLNVVLDKQK